ncbi:MAG: PIG-L family deacetylase [Actinobacteria bacterium]|nr:PIG-L family deacetylase [Actinomycetota bacterium]
MEDGPVLFVFAHQDDEFVYLGMLRNLFEREREIHVVWITDGAHFVPAEVRRAESTAVMRMVGLGEDRLSFWPYPDGTSIRFAPEIVERLAQTMEEARPSEVYTVAFEGGHPDHDMANFASVTAARRLDPSLPVYEAPLYNRHRGKLWTINRFIPAETETLYVPLSRDDILFKLRALFKYRSQFWIAVLPTLLFTNKKETVTRGEPYRRVPAWNYRQPPHGGKLIYEGFLLRRILGIVFKDFREAVSGVLDPVDRA